MKVVYNLIKYPLIYSFIGCLILELITFVVFFVTFKSNLVKNESKIKETLITQTEEFFNSISFLILSKLNSVENELLLFNQHMSIKDKYDIDILKTNLGSCDIRHNFYVTGDLIISELEKIANEDLNRTTKLNKLLEYPYINQISFFTSDISYQFTHDFMSLDGKIRTNICYALSFIKTAYIKNIINKQYREKLNYTLYTDDVIFFYPAKRIDATILKTLPFYNPSILCRDQKYIFECSSILKYQPTEENFTLYNSIIYMKLKLLNQNLYINSCLSINDRENNKTNMDPYFLYTEDTYPDYPPNNFFCIASNITNILEGINQDSNFFIFNIIQYDEENDNIQVLYSSNENFYKDISLNKHSQINLYSDERYGKYRIEDNSNENIADLFHSIYYEIEKYDHPKKNIEELINEYEENTKEIKELMASKDYRTINGIKFEVEQSHMNYIYDNKGQRKYNESYLNKNQFIYFLKPIVSDMAKINNNSNIIEKNGKYKKIVFYTLTIMKVTKPKNTSFIYAIYLFICGRIFFYSLSLEFFICIIIYIFLFFIMRCILNPIRTFKTSLGQLLDEQSKNHSDDEIHKNIMPETENKNSTEINALKKLRQQEKYNNNENQIKNTDLNNINKKEKNKDITKNKYINNFIKITSEIEKQYTNLEMKEIENIICFLQKILLLRDDNTPYQAKAEFYQSISSEISKKYQLDLFKCQILIGEYYIKDRQYLKAKNELENLQIRIEQSKNELENKDKFNERKNGLLSTYYNTYINDFTTNTTLREDKFIRLEMISESAHYLIGLANYFLFLELKHGKKKILNELRKQKTININKNSYNRDFKNSNYNNSFDIKTSSNNIISQMDYYLERAIRHFKESYKINNSLQINQIKNIIILVYLSKCYMEFSNKSIEDANKVLKKAFLTLSNFNDLIIELTDNEYSVKRKKANTNFDYLFYKNYGSYMSHNAKECYVDSRVMLIVNGILIQFILYQIGKMSLKLHKYKVSYYCFVKLIQISFFKNEDLHFKSIKWIRFLLNDFLERKKNTNIGLKSLSTRFKAKRTNSSNSFYWINEDEVYIKKSSIDYMKKYLKSLVELFEKNKYKRREKKTIIELLSALEKKLVYRQKNIKNEQKRPNFRNFAKNYISKLNQTESSLTSSKEFNHSSGGFDIYGNQENDESPGTRKYLNERNDEPSTPKNLNKRKTHEFEKVISRSEYESIIKSFINRDLLIGQIINSPLKIKDEEKLMKYIDKQYFRLNPKERRRKCLIIILSESFLQIFSSLKSFNLFIQDCIEKFLEENDKIGFILFSFSSGYNDKTYELEYKAKSLKILDELFGLASSINKNKNSSNKKKYLTDSFNMAMEMFNNEQLNNNTDDINIKTDKYIFCFGTLNNLRYNCYEASFSQKNRLNYMEISLYYFVFDSIDYYREKLPHYKKYFKKFIEGFLVFVENFKLIKLCFANICLKGKQKNLFSNKLECIQNII